MKVTGAMYVGYDQGHAVLRLDFSGNPTGSPVGAVIYSDQKRTLVQDGRVYLGGEWEPYISSRMSVTGRSDWNGVGVTDDFEIVRLVRLFLKDVDEGTYQPGKKLV